MWPLLLLSAVKNRTACLSVLSNVTFHPGLAKSRGFAIPDPSSRYWYNASQGADALQHFCEVKLTREAWLAQPA